MLGYVTGFIRQLKHKKKESNDILRRHFEVMWTELFKVQILLEGVCVFVAKVTRPEKKFTHVFPLEMEQFLQNVREGDFVTNLDVEKAKVSQKVTELELKEKEQCTDLPEEIDKKALNEWLLDIRRNQLLKGDQY